MIQDDALTTTTETAHVLLVEDNENDLALALHELGQLGEGYSFEHVSTKEAFLDALALEPQLIVTDYALPQFSAHEVLKLLRERGLTCPVIVVSGALSDRQAAELLRSGASDYLLKDRLARLRVSVQEALRKHRLERDQKRSELEMQQFFELSLDPMAILDFDASIKRTNEGWKRVLGWLPEQLNFAALSQVTHPEDHESASRQFARLMGGQEAEFEARFQPPEGSERWLQWRFHPVTQLGCIFVVVRDITDNKLLRLQLERLAHYDALTDLPNRRYFEKHFERVSIHRRQTDRRFFLAHMDLNKFKLVNDTYGHVVADELLVQIAQRLRNNVRDNECVARLGGDEFVFLLEANSVRQVKVAVTRIVDVLEAPYELSDTELHIQASVGVASLPESEASFATMLRAADQAMYRAKAAGGGIYFNVPGSAPQQTEKYWFESQLRRALSEDQLYCDFQPIIDLATNVPAWYEALLRWRHPERGLIAPDTFIPMAEEFGLIQEIDRLVLRKALEQAKCSGIAVAVNVAPQTLQAHDLPQLLAQQLSSAGLEPSALHIEITERVLAEPEKMLPQLAALRDLGVQIAVDDFGTGYSALSYLNNYPIDVLKLDRSFVNNLEWTEAARTIAELIIRLAHDLNLRTVAEGVETRWQLDWLERSGCDLAQGFYLKRPLSLRELARSGDMPYT